MLFSPQKHAFLADWHPLAHAVCFISWALSSHAAANTPPDAPGLSEVTVTGNALGNNDGVLAVESLQGEELLMKSKSTLGETLSSSPGVASSYFGPNASRPIIRGMDGDRIKILSNSASTQDVSALSNDHALPHDPLVVERVEVLRGPSAIMYGGSAVGGVVNLIDNRIPNQPMEGVSGRADGSWDSGTKGSNAGVLIEAGNQQHALHLDVFGRNSDDVSVPDAMNCSKVGSAISANRICNSEQSSQGLALGGSVFWDKGYLGMSASTYDSDYGTVAEDTVSIGMRSNRVNLAAEVREPLTGLDKLSIQAGDTHYQHTEFEDGNVGTVFTQKGQDWRISAKHQPWSTSWGQLRGVWGLHAEKTQFQADGEERFMPSTQTGQSALYVVEELSQPWGTINLGLRSDQVTVKGEAFKTTPETSQRFQPVSSALGLQFNVTPSLSLRSHLAQTQRAPKDYELRADGVHVATNAYEQGLSSLEIEKARQIDLGLHWTDGPHRVDVHYFVTRFNNYIGLNDAGVDVDDQNVAGCIGGSCFPRYTFGAIQAEFSGMELKSHWRLTGEKGLISKTSDAIWDLKLQADQVRASNRDTGEPLPRIPPFRIGVHLSRLEGPWRVTVGADKSNSPRTAVRQLPTPGYTLWNAQLAYVQKIKANQAIWYVKATNLTDQLAYSATSVLTSTALDEVSGRSKAPLPGRNIKLGVQVYF